MCGEFVRATQPDNYVTLLFHVSASDEWEGPIEQSETSELPDGVPTCSDVMEGRVSRGYYERNP